MTPVPVKKAAKTQVDELYELKELNELNDENTEPDARGFVLIMMTPRVVRGVSF